MYLLDTNVISELRAPRLRRSDSSVLRWASSVAANSLYLSVVTIFEIQLGMLQLQRRDCIQAEVLRLWIETRVLPGFAGRILPVDIEVAQPGASLHIPDRRLERDAYVAATALVHKMTVVTRNTADFTPTGVPTLNPWLA